MEDLKGQEEKAQISIKDISVFPTETFNSLSPGGRKQVESTLMHAERIITLADRLLSLGGMATTWEHKPGDGYRKSVHTEKTMETLDRILVLRLCLMIEENWSVLG